MLEGVTERGRISFGQETRREIEDLQAGRVLPVGEFTVASGTTSTVVFNRLCSTTSIVNVMPYDPLGGAGATHIRPDNGFFTLYHGNSPSPCKVRYVIHTGPRGSVTP